MRVVAYFESVPDLERAARDARLEGWRVLAACSPAFDEQVLEAVRATRSPVAMSGLLGGIAGLISGLLLTIGTVREWPGLIVSGKPLISMPPFLIIVFELTILGASIGAVWSFLVASVRARRDGDAAWDVTTTDDRFSLLLEPLDAVAERQDAVLRRLRSSAWRRVSE
jgi:hypothetical protein